MKVRWSSDAEDDRDAIRSFIAAENPRGALRVDEAIGEAVGRLDDFPHSGRPGLLSDTREVLAHSHYRIVYVIWDDTVWIVAVVHTSRQWPPATDEDDI